MRGLTGSQGGEFLVSSVQLSVGTKLIRLMSGIRLKTIYSHPQSG
jgi:hypothetical protein